MNAPVLEIRNLFKAFDLPGWIIEDFSLRVQAGEFLCVLGPSGCGKTTLLRLICGFESPERGEILQEGRTISRPGWILPPEERRIGMVFQDFAIFPHLTVRGNVGFGLMRPLYERLLRRFLHWLGGRPAPSEFKGARAREHRLAQLFEMTGLQGFERRFPHELSGGQQQRVALARALAPDPRLLLLDEPFSNLDTTLRVRIREEVREVLKESGTTSILVTHDQEEAVAIADRIAVMNRGRLEQLGTADELLHDPRSRFVATFIGLSDFIRGTLAEGAVQTELGNFPLPPGNNHLSPGPVDVLLRPDHFQPAQNGKGIMTRVVKVSYTGVQSLFTLALPSGTTVQVFFPGHAHLSPGDTAAIKFQPPRLVVFPAA